jgi:cholesterol oxidase
VVFSAGVLGTMPLLFRCREQGSLPELSPTLGHRVRTNSETLNGITTTHDEVSYSRGVAITSSIYVDEVTHIEPCRFPEGSDLLSPLDTPMTDGSPRSRPWRWLAGNLLHPINFLRTCWPFGWAKRSIILLVMQTLDNSVRMFRKRRWWWPFRRTLATEREDQRVRIPALIPQAQVAARIAGKHMRGIPKTVITEVLFNMGFTAHILGGCAIGPDPEHGVIDGQNRVYGHQGLYVVDGSMMPANLGVNPSLTITAMAEHAMSHVPPKERTP